MTKFETALQREFSERLKSINLNFIHTTNYTWGKTVIIPYTQNGEHKQLREAQIDILNRLKGKLEDYEDHCLEMHDWQGQTAINECEKYIDEIIKEIRGQ